MSKTDKRAWEREFIEIEGKTEERWFRCFVKIAYKKDKRNAHDNSCYGSPQNLISIAFLFISVSLLLCQELLECSGSCDGKGHLVRVCLRGKSRG